MCEVDIAVILCQFVIQRNTAVIFWHFLNIKTETMNSYARQLEIEEIEEIRIALKKIQLHVGVGALHSGHLVANRALFERIRVLMEENCTYIDN